MDIANRDAGDLDAESLIATWKKKEEWGQRNTRGKSLALNTTDPVSISDPQAPPGELLEHRARRNPCS